MPRPSRSRSPAPDHEAPSDGGASDLSFRQAQTALELALAELQTSDLDVEAMASLYQRAQAYADRCEALLNQVEQEVMQWDPQLPDQPPRPLQA
ncbi:MAG: exodeoxyribonuclease VII small subunit [Synechococcaceae cyanobacterium]|nr:exodeoxyribonuclease VII small subunit [Synechococcaceae cyanobacterium]